jgi:hypothetical protein
MPPEPEGLGDGLPVGETVGDKLGDIVGVGVETPAAQLPTGRLKNVGIITAQATVRKLKRFLVFELPGLCTHQA